MRHAQIIMNYVNSETDEHSKTGETIVEKFGRN